jgi:hypothetical protein
MRQLPVVLCIDVEPDPRVFDPADPPPWLGFERLIEVLPDLRERIEEATGQPARFSWFLRMDPQIAETWGSAGWLSDAYGDEFAGLSEAGDELGLHSHVWRWDPDVGDWFADYSDPDWAQHCVRTGLDAFESGFGRPCMAHRAGDHFINPAIFSLLAERRVRVDFSLEPGMSSLSGLGIEGERFQGRIPDFVGVPTRPYRATPASFPDPDAAGSDPLLVPLLSAPGRRPPFRRLPLSPVQAFSVFAPRLAVELLRRPPAIAVAMRSDSVLSHEWDQIQRNLVHLARRRGAVFETASAVAERWEQPRDPARAPGPRAGHLGDA